MPAESRNCEALSLECRQNLLAGRQADQFESEALVRQSPLVEEWEAEESHYCKSLRSNAELVLRQSPASKDVNTEVHGLGSRYQATSEDTAD
jgi:hypothetical protein